MPQLSLIIHTASPDSFLLRQGIPSYFRALVRNLHQQTFSDFELVYVDTYHDQNAAEFAGVTAPFQIKHVPVHPEHRYWYDKGYCFIAAAKNTGILYADGELCVSCDDGEFFPPQLLQSYWDNYRRGFLAHALHKRMRGIETDESGTPTIPLAGDFYVNDHRWERLGGHTRMNHTHGSWLYAGTSFPLEVALRINGYNERMDGCKSLEDCDFGNRMRMVEQQFCLARDCWLAIVDHPSYGDIPTTVEDGQRTEQGVCAMRQIANFIAVENFGMLQCALEVPEPVANRNGLTAQHMQIIQRETIKYRHFDPLAPERKAELDLWLGTPTFELRAQRAALRQSPDWKWA